MKLKLHTTAKKQYYSGGSEDQMLFNRVNSHSCILFRYAHKIIDAHLKW